MKIVLIYVVQFNFNYKKINGYHSVYNLGLVKWGMAFYCAHLRASLWKNGYSSYHNLILVVLLCMGRPLSIHMNRNHPYAWMGTSYRSFSIRSPRWIRAKLGYRAIYLRYYKLVLIGMGRKTAFCHGHVPFHIRLGRNSFWYHGTWHDAVLDYETCKQY